MDAYADLEIRIFERQPPGYPVEFTLNNEQQFQRGFLAPDILPWKSSTSPGEDGKRLLECLLADGKLRDAWAEVRGRYPKRRIRLRIDTAAPELHAIPWELVREAPDAPTPEQNGPTTFPALDLAASTATPFSRYLAGRWTPGSPVLKRPLKILAVIADPNLETYPALAKVDRQHEMDILKTATAGQKIEISELPGPTTLAAIEAELRNGYHVLHFVGHGAFVSEKAVLFMADQGNQPARVTGQELAEMLSRQLADTDQGQEDKLRLVYLSSCDTAVTGSADAFRGLAPSLVAAGVPAVVAMQDKVPIVTAQQFTQTFYTQLLAHGQVDLAVNEARSAIITSKLPGASIPVLYSRLRSNQLLGLRGHISSGSEEEFWPFLIDAIHDGRVTAFLGPRVLDGLLPNREAIAQELADKYEYPLPDKTDLIRVAQFITTNALQKPKETLTSAYLRYLQRSLFKFLDIQPTEDQKKQFKNSSLSETVLALGWAERVLAVQEDEIHHKLADLQLPLYITTNPDNFMFAALMQKHQNGETQAPRRVGLRWEQPEAGRPQYVLTPPPSQEAPVVLHLNGFDGDPEQEKNLVLSEDDYMRHLVRLARDQQSILPMNVQTMLAEHSYLFLGFDLDDWDFRLLLHGLLHDRKDANTQGPLHIGVQLELDPGSDSRLNMEKAMKYLGKYMSKYSINIYWGSTQQFVNDLHDRWQNSLEESDDDW